MSFFSVVSNGLSLWSVPVQCQQAKGNSANLICVAKVTVETIHEFLALLEVVLEDFGVILAASTHGQNVCVLS